MENNWPETTDELVEECEKLISRFDLYTLGEKGEPFAGEDEPRVDGAEYLAGEYQYGVAMIPAQWVTHVVEAATLGSEINGDTSDGYHTFNELYHHRAVLFSVCVAANSSKAWKARKHHDGTMYDGMFIVGIDTPEGQATYHYDLDPYWDMFWCRELESAPEWDGHTPGEAIERIASLRNVVMKGPRGRR